MKSSHLVVPPLHACCCERILYLDSTVVTLQWEGDTQHTVASLDGIQNALGLQNGLQDSLGLVKVHQHHLQETRLLLGVVDRTIPTLSLSNGMGVRACVCARVCEPFVIPQLFVVVVAAFTSLDDHFTCETVDEAVMAGSTVGRAKA